MNHTPTIRPHFPALDGLRGIAILMVLLSHYFSYIPALALLGSFGVDLFFVLSGFLITDILIRTRQEPNYYRNFYQHRILRIFPLYYLSLILFFTLGPLSPQMDTQYHYYAGHWPLIVFHLNNLAQLLYHKPATDLMLNHYWSLSLEEQFYLFWPVFVQLAAGRTKLLRLISIVIIMAIMARLITWLLVKDYYAFWYTATNIRIDCLAVGALLACLRIYWPDNSKTIFMRFCIAIFSVHLIAFLVKTFLVPSLPHFTVIGYSSYAAVCGLVIIQCINATPITGPMANSVLRFFGRISYGLYIFHLPVLILSQYYLFPWLLSKVPGSPDTAMVVARLLIAGIAILLSTLSYYCFEKFFLKLKYPNEGVAEAAR